LRNMFEQYSTQRGEFADELLQAGRDLGIDIANPIGISGALHAGWMELKGALSGHSERQILEECERGEDLSIKTYRQALKMNLYPESARFSNVRSPIWKAREPVSGRSSTLAPAKRPTIGRTKPSDLRASVAAAVGAESSARGRAGGESWRAAAVAVSARSHLERRRRPYQQRIHLILIVVVGVRIRIAHRYPLVAETIAAIVNRRLARLLIERCRGAGV
jgi:hypothetical protein